MRQVWRLLALLRLLQVGQIAALFGAVAWILIIGDMHHDGWRVTVDRFPMDLLRVNEPRWVLLRTKVCTPWCFRSFSELWMRAL